MNLPAPTFAGRVAFVTGAASGLGRATAEGLAQGGASVVLFDRDEAGLRRTAEACSNALCVTGDVTVAADVGRAVASAAALGTITLLASAAGIIGPTVPLTEMAEPDWDRLFAVNAKGTWLTLKAVLPQMQSAGQGSIVTFASAAGLTGSPALPAYSASKAAVVMMSRSLARTHAAEGIRVNCVCPGSIETPMLEATFAGAPSSAARTEREAEFLARHPMLRFGKATEVASAVLFLLSDAASFITGAALPIDGGRLA